MILGELNVVVAASHKIRHRINETEHLVTVKPKSVSLRFRLRPDRYNRPFKR
jgi:hypothetical protein